MGEELRTVTHAQPQALTPQGGNGLGFIPNATIPS